MNKIFNMPPLFEPEADVIGLEALRDYALEYGQCVAAAYALHHASTRAELTVLAQQLSEQATALIASARKLDAEHLEQITQLKNELALARANSPQQAGTFDPWKGTDRR